MPFSGNGCPAYPNVVQTATFCVLPAYPEPEKNCLVLNMYMFMPVVSILGEAKCAVVWLLVVWVYVQWFVGLLRKNEFWEGVNLTVIAKSNRVEYVDSINY